MADGEENPESITVADDQMYETYRYRVRFQLCVRSFASPETLSALECSGEDRDEPFATLLWSRDDRLDVVRCPRLNEERT